MRIHVKDGRQTVTLYKYDRVHLTKAREILAAVKANTRESVENAAGDYGVAAIDVVMRKYRLETPDQDEAAA